MFGAGRLRPVVPVGPAVGGSGAFSGWLAVFSAGSGAAAFGFAAGFFTAAAFFRAAFGFAVAFFFAAGLRAAAIE